MYSDSPFVKAREDFRRVGVLLLDAKQPFTEYSSPLGLLSEKGLERRPLKERRVLDLFRLMPMERMLLL